MHVLSEVGHSFGIGGRFPSITYCARPSYGGGVRIKKEIKLRLNKLKFSVRLSVRVRVGIKGYILV